MWPVHMSAVKGKQGKISLVAKLDRETGVNEHEQRWVI